MSKPKVADRDTVVRSTQVRTKLKGDGSWCKTGRDTEDEPQEEKPWLADLKARRLNGGPVETSPVTSPVKATRPPIPAKPETGRAPTTGYRTSGVFTQPDKSVTSSTSNGFSQTTQFTKKPSDSYKIIAPHTVRPTSENQGDQLSSEEQEKRTEAASNVLMKSSAKQRSYVLSAAKKFESQPPDTTVVNNTVSFVATRVEITDEDEKPVSAVQPSPVVPVTSVASAPEPSPWKTVNTSVKTVVNVTVNEPVTPVPDKEAPPPASVGNKDLFEDMKSGCTKVATPLPELITECIQAASSKPESEVSNISTQDDKLVVDRNIVPSKLRQWPPPKPAADDSDDLEPPAPVLRPTVSPTAASPAPVAPVGPVRVLPAPVAPTPVSPTPVSRTPVSPTPVAPTPMSPTPVSPTPMSPTPVSRTPMSPTRVAPTPMSPTPVAPTPMSPTPVAPTLISPTPVAPTPISRTPMSPTRVAPTPMSPTPVAPTPMSPTPVAPTLISPTPVAPTPISRTPMSPTPVAPVTPVRVLPAPMSPTPVAPSSMSPTLVSRTPMSPTPVAPTLISPTPVAPTPISRTPMSPTPVAPVAPVAPVRVLPAPVAPAPVAQTPASPTPVSPTAVAPTPISRTPMSPTPVSRTPMSPTPVSPTPVAPTPISPTPVAPTPMSPTPVSTTPVASTPLWPTTAVTVSTESKYEPKPAPEWKHSPKPSSSGDTLSALSDTLLSFDTKSSSIRNDESALPNEEVGSKDTTEDRAEGDDDEDSDDSEEHYKDTDSDKSVGSCEGLSDDSDIDPSGDEEEKEEPAMPAPTSPGRYSLELLSELRSESTPQKTSGTLDLLADKITVINSEARSLSMQREDEKQTDETAKETQSKEDNADRWSSRVRTTATEWSSADPFDPYPIGTTSPNSSSDLLQPLSSISINRESSTEYQKPRMSGNALGSLADDIIPIDTGATRISTRRSWTRTLETSTPLQASTGESQDEEGQVENPQTMIKFERKSSENDSPWDRWTSPTVYNIATEEDEQEDDKREMHSEPEPVMDRYESYSRTVIRDEPRVPTPEPENKKGFVYLKEYVNATETSSLNSRDGLDSEYDYLTSSSLNYAYSSPSYSRTPLSSTCTYCGQQVGDDSKITIEHLGINCHPTCFKCGVCSKPMGDLLHSMFIHGGKVHCESCYSKV